MHMQLLLQMNGTYKTGKKYYITSFMLSKLPLKEDNVYIHAQVMHVYLKNTTKQKNTFVISFPSNKYVQLQCYLLSVLLYLVII
jgi:hypothetical protein